MINFMLCDVYYKREKKNQCLKLIKFFHLGQKWGNGKMERNGVGGPILEKDK